MLPTSHLPKERDFTALLFSANADVPIQVVLFYSSQIPLAFEKQSEMDNHASVKRILSRQKRLEMDHRAVYMLLNSQYAT